jgi:2-polyprenyl-3-methyl-5-hydroxy-6-metoxy-1,4-benzoquinol methylase
MPITKTEFDKVYDAEVLGRRFVEYLDYYRQSRPRFWLCFKRIEALGLPRGARVLDIGGGITGVLLNRLLGHEAIVADVVETARADVEALGLGFVKLDLFRDGEPPVTDLDLVVLQEVIEHIPQPPYIVFERIRKLLRPGGRLFLTTPNGHRIRNLVYMALGKEILDVYRYPGDTGEGLGHQHEYTLQQMLWQADMSSLEVEEAAYYRDRWGGASPVAKVGRALTAPAELIPYMRNAITMTLKVPE